MLLYENCQKVKGIESYGAQEIKEKQTAHLITHVTHFL
jgi:hypothetical protein